MTNKDKEYSSKRIYDLKRGDKVRHGLDGELLEFVKIDGMYGQWKTADGSIKIGHTDFYIKNKDGIYIGTAKQSFFTHKAIENSCNECLILASKPVKKGEKIMCDKHWNIEKFEGENKQ